MKLKSLFSVLSAGRILTTALLLSGAIKLEAAEILPVETFARLPAISHPVISRDGRTLCYGATVTTASGTVDQAMVFKDLDGKQSYGWDIPANRSLGRPIWVAEDRVIYGYLASVDREGKNYRGLLGPARDEDLRDQQRLIARGDMFDRFTGDNEGSLLMREYDEPASYGRYYLFYLTYPNVVQMNSRTGAFTRIVKNPGKVTNWLADGKGFVRVGIEQDGAMTRILFRNIENELWHVAAGLDYTKRGPQPIYLSADGATLYLSKVTPEGNWGVYTYDLAKQKMGDLLLSHGRYDILPLNSAVSQDGFALERIVTAPKTREVLGVQFVTDKPRVAWFEPQLAQVQAALDQNFPDKINTIVDLSDNLQRMVVLSWSANDLGMYYLFDLGQRQLKPLFKRAPWIKAEQMGEVKPISYVSRDGLTIHGYLTLPHGADPKKKLPLVVYPHGGPFVRDTYDFNYDVQFLANRGYAVLQMNYRGSPGFGEAFAKKGMRAMGRGIQDDIEDGTRWAIAQGVADPGRIAIMGWGFGGYSAAIQSTRSPDLYRCAIDLAGITDWKAFMKYTSEMQPVERQMNADNLGDPVADAAELDDISPVNHVDKLRAPMLLVYSKDGYIVPYDQMKLLTGALDKAGKPYEVLTRAWELGGGFTDVKNRTALYTAIEAFLAKNMAPK